MTDHLRSDSFFVYLQWYHLGNLNLTYPISIAVTRTIPNVKQSATSTCQPFLNNCMSVFTFYSSSMMVKINFDLKLWGWFLVGSKLELLGSQIKTIYQYLSNNIQEPKRDFFTLNQFSIKSILLILCNSKMNNLLLTFIIRKILIFRIF